jgi:hypothetical protein
MEHNWHNNGNAEMRSYNSNTGPVFAKDGFGFHHHIDDSYTRQMRRGYFAAVSFVDACIGRVLDALETHGFKDNTIVTIWGDHGAYSSCFESQSRLHYFLPHCLHYFLPHAGLSQDGTLATKTHGISVDFDQTHSHMLTETSPLRFPTPPPLPSPPPNGLVVSKGRQLCCLPSQHISLFEHKYFGWESPS